MRLLFTSDLHLCGDTLADQERVLREGVREHCPDVLAVSGDVSDCGRDFNPYLFLGNLGVPVAFCLGNHEFAGRTVEETLETYRGYRDEAIEAGIGHVRCLDVDGHFDVDGVRFYGNVLWYDGSLCNLPTRDALMERVWDRWLDSTIVGFRPLEEHLRCVEAILEAQRGAPAGSGLVLLTHTVPLRELNAFDRLKPDSIPNCYSGVDDLFARHGVAPDLALCGHTHRRAECRYELPDGRICRCLNSGNDYFFGRGGRIVFDELEV